MSNELANLAGALANSDLFKGLLQENDKLAGGGGDYKRISIKGSKFRMMVGGEQISVNKEDNIDIVVIDAAPIARTYYDGSYDPKNTTPPICWSADTKVPSPDVDIEDRQSDKCSTCPQSIKGSGQGDSRACRFSQRLAIVLADDLETVYQMQLPATSIFGGAENGQLPMQAYARFLSANKAPAIAVVTNMYFDTEAETPKLFFKATGPLTETQLNTVVEVRGTDAVKLALEMTVSQTDKVEKTEAKSKPEIDEEDAPKPKTRTRKPATKPKVVEQEEEQEEDVEEPVKAEKKKSPNAKVDEDLSSIIDDWDDE